MQTAIDMNNSKDVRDVIAVHAYTSGMKAGAMTAAVMATGVFTANKYSPTFRNRLGVSGKWGLVVSSFLGAFAITSDKALVRGAREPEKYLASFDPNSAVQLQVGGASHHQLPLYQRAANFLYDHPYKTLMGVGAPLVGGIFAYQSTNHALARSQQIMHTRIYGQGAVVVLLLSSMAFHDYMHKRGRFEEEDVVVVDTSSDSDNTVIDDQQQQQPQQDALQR